MIDNKTFTRRIFQLFFNFNPPNLELFVKTYAKINEINKILNIFNIFEVRFNKWFFVFPRSLHIHKKVDDFDSVEAGEMVS